MFHKCSLLDEKKKKKTSKNVADTTFKIFKTGFHFYLKIKATKYGM